MAHYSHVFGIKRLTSKELRVQIYNDIAVKRKLQLNHHPPHPLSLMQVSHNLHHHSSPASRLVGNSVSYICIYVLWCVILHSWCHYQSLFIAVSSQSMLTPQRGQHSMLTPQRHQQSMSTPQTQQQSMLTPQQLLTPQQTSTPGPGVRL